MRFMSFDCVANEDPEITKRESATLFRKAKRSIMIIGGDLNSDFYNDDRVVKALGKAIGRNVIVDIAYCPSEPGKKPESRAVKLKGLRLWLLEKAVSRHAMSIDGKAVRIEMKHPPGAKMTPAIICKDASSTAQEIEWKFETLRKTPVEA